MKESSEFAEIEKALSEQKAYYQARAQEYDEWFLRRGRYDRGPEHREAWETEVESVASKLKALAPFGDVLEFAGGTGIWTEKLAPHARSLTVVDASLEMISLNRNRVGEGIATYFHDDIFHFEPRNQVDFIFFGFWLSHVPTDRFDEFWNLVKRCLKPGGQFFFVDSQREPLSTAADHELPVDKTDEMLVRTLNDGRQFRIFKIFYEPEALEQRLASLGLDAKVNETETFFVYGNGRMVSSSEVLGEEIR